MKYQPPRFARRKPEFQNKPIDEPGIYEWKEIDEFGEVESSGTILVSWADGLGLLYCHYPDGVEFYPLDDWGIGDWIDDDCRFWQRKIATNQNRLWGKDS